MPQNAVEVDWGLTHSHPDQQNAPPEAVSRAVADTATSATKAGAQEGRDMGDWSRRLADPDSDRWSDRYFWRHHPQYGALGICRQQQHARGDQPRRQRAAR
jgi:hypothetical protein